MSENLRRFVEAVYAFDAVVRRTGDDQWDNPTPCEGWTARDLLQHQCAVLNGVEAVASSGQMAKPSAPEDMADPQAVWTDTRDRLLQSLDSAGVLQQAGPFWFNAATLDDMIGIVAWDPTTHAWDLATAVGGHHGLSDELLSFCHQTVEPMSDMLVETERTGPRVEPAADASTLERYLALVGRSA